MYTLPVCISLMLFYSDKSCRAVLLVTRQFRGGSGPASHRRSSTRRYVSLVVDGVHRPHPASQRIVLQQLSQAVPTSSTEFLRFQVYTLYVVSARLQFSVEHSSGLPTVPSFDGRRICIRRLRHAVRRHEFRSLTGEATHRI